MAFAGCGDVTAQTPRNQGFEFLFVELRAPPAHAQIGALPAPPPPVAVPRRRVTGKFCYPGQEGQKKGGALPPAGQDAGMSALPSEGLPAEGGLALAAAGPAEAVPPPTASLAGLGEGPQPAPPPGRGRFFTAVSTSQLRGTGTR